VYTLHRKFGLSICPRLGWKCAELSWQPQVTGHRLALRQSKARVVALFWQQPNEASSQRSFLDFRVSPFPCALLGAVVKKSQFETCRIHSHLGPTSWRLHLQPHAVLYAIRTTEWLSFVVHPGFVFWCHCLDLFLFWWFYRTTFPGCSLVSGGPWLGSPVRLRVLLISGGCFLL